MGKKVKFNRQKYSASEFNDSLLPANRFKQFFDVFKIEWSTLLRIGFLFLLFLLPLILISTFKPVVASFICENVVRAGGGQPEINYALNIINVIYYALCVVCFLIFSICLAGVSKIIKNLCFGEGVLFRTDFFNGIKENWKRFILFTLIGSAFFYLTKFNDTFFTSSDNFIFKFIIYLATFILYIFVLPILFFAMFNQISYKMNFIECVGNGFKFTLAKILYSLIFSIIIYGFTFIEKIKHPIVFALVLILSIIIVFPLYFLSFHLLSQYIADEYINKENYKEIYRKGLKPLLIEEKEK